MGEDFDKNLTPGQVSKLKNANTTLRDVERNFSKYKHICHQTDDLSSLRILNTT